MTATTTAGHPPVLRFDSQPDGGPPPILCTSGHDYAFRPAGGPPMLVLRRRPDVLHVLTSTRNFGMAAVTRTGGCSAARSPARKCNPRTAAC